MSEPDNWDFDSRCDVADDIRIKVYLDGKAIANWIAYKQGDAGIVLVERLRKERSKILVTLHGKVRVVHIIRSDESWPEVSTPD